MNKRRRWKAKARRRLAKLPRLVFSPEIFARFSRSENQWDLWRNRALRATGQVTINGRYIEVPER